MNGIGKHQIMNYSGVRIKTEAQMLEAYGKNWRVHTEWSYNVGGPMDDLLGKRIEGVLAARDVNTILIDRSNQFFNVLLYGYNKYSISKAMLDSSLRAFTSFKENDR